MFRFFSKLLGTSSAQQKNFISFERVYCLEGDEPKDILFDPFLKWRIF